MPVIEIQGDSADGARVLSYMYFPSNDAGRDHLFSDLTSSNDDLMQSDSERTLSDMQAANRWTKEVSDAGLRGTAAGEMLVWFALMLRVDCPEPSKHKAVAAMRNLSLDLKQDPETGQVIEGGEAGVIPDDDSTFWKYLTRYKDVCHLWASHWVLSRNHAFYRIPEVLRDGGQLETFLAHAAWFLELGESHTTRNDRGWPVGGAGNGIRALGCDSSHSTGAWFASRSFN